MRQAGKQSIPCEKWQHSVDFFHQSAECGQLPHCELSHTKLTRRQRSVDVAELAQGDKEAN